MERKEGTLISPGDGFFSPAMKAAVCTIVKHVFRRRLLAMMLPALQDSPNGREIACLKYWRSLMIPRSDSMYPEPPFHGAARLGRTGVIDEYRG